MALFLVGVARVCFSSFPLTTYLTIRFVAGPPTARMRAGPPRRPPSPAPWAPQLPPAPPAGVCVGGGWVVGGWLVGGGWMGGVCVRARKRTLRQHAAPPPRITRHQPHQPVVARHPTRVVPVHTHCLPVCPPAVPAAVSSLSARDLDYLYSRQRKFKTYLEAAAAAYVDSFRQATYSLPAGTALKPSQEAPAEPATASAIMVNGPAMPLLVSAADDQVYMAAAEYGMGRVVVLSADVVTRGGAIAARYLPLVKHAVLWASAGAGKALAPPYRRVALAYDTPGLRALAKVLIVSAARWTADGRRAG